MMADLLLYNANVLTLDTNYREAQLVAIRDGRILTVGGNEARQAFMGPSTVAIDCQGKTVLPGFNDAHCHFMALAKHLISLDLSPSRVRSILDIRGEIGRLARRLPPGSWITAGRYDEFYLAEKRHPTRWDLDEATSLHPVKLTHRSGHAHVLNSLALRLVGISNETPEPGGGIIERDWETGEPNGLLYDMDDFLNRKVPPLSYDELEQGVNLANQELLSLGITSIQDLSAENDIERWQMFHRWKREGNLRCRLSFALGLEGFNQYQEEGLPPDLDKSEVHLGGVKIILQETTGRLSPTMAELEPILLRIHQSDLQIAFHAVEETSIEAACSILERLLHNSPRIDHRHRIEHCSVCRPEIAKRLASLEVVVVTQPSFVYYHGERYLKTMCEKELGYLYPIATLLRAGVKVAAGSDSPVVNPNPLVAIYAAISRKTTTGETVSAGEGISLAQALWTYTGGAAYASFEEAVKGSVIPGKLADLVVLSHDLIKIPVDEIKNVKVDMTFVGGEIVWQREA